MAKIDFTPGIDGSKGALSKQGIITRQKIYRDDRGRIVSYGKQEGYIVAHPRNFKRHPMKDRELAHHNLWRDVCLQAKSELANSERKAQWQQRFNAQLPTTPESAPDAQAPIVESTGAQKRYVQLYAFVRAMIYQQLKANNNG